MTDRPVSPSDAAFDDEALAEPALQMEAVQAATSAASEAIRRRYFPTHAVPVWVGEF